MVSTNTLNVAGRSEVLNPGGRRLLRLAALLGVAGLALRFLATARYQNPVSSSAGGIFGYPESGVAPAVASGLGVLFVAFAFIVLYRSMAERLVARNVALLGIGAVLVATFSGIELSVDSAVVGSVLLAFGVAIAAGRTYPTWLGWLGVAAGIGLIVGALVSGQIAFWARVSDVEQATAVASSAVFVSAMSTAMWLRSRGPSPLKGATQS
jgi:hypothetical protein